MLVRAFIFVYGELNLPEDPYDKALTDRPSGREVPLRRPTNTRRRQHRALPRRVAGRPGRRARACRGAGPTASVKPAL